MPEPTKPFIPPKTVKPSGITPDAGPKEPPKEILEQTFTLDPSLLNDGGSGQITIEDNHGTVKTLKGDGTKPGEGAKADESKPSDTSSASSNSNDNGQKPRGEDGKFTKIEESKGEPTAEKKVEEKVSVLKPPQPEKKDGADKKDAVEKVVTTPIEKKQFTPPSKEQKAEVRDYSGYSDDEVKVLKQMSNEAFTFTTNLLKTNKEAVKLKDASYLQHPEAYRLSPDFQAAQNQVYFAQTEAKCWEASLELCKDGKKFRYVTGFDERGQPQFSKEELDPTGASEEILRANMIRCQSVAQQKQAELSNIGPTFQNRVKEDVKGIQSIRAEKFAWVTDPKLLDYTIDVGGVDKSIKAIRSELISVFPPYLQNNIATEVCADLMVALMIQSAELNAAQSGQKIAETQKEEIARGEPTSQQREKEDVSVNGVKTFTLEGRPS